MQSSRRFRDFFPSNFGLPRPSRRQPRFGLAFHKLHVEQLEERRMLAVFTVDSTADTPDTNPGDGECESVVGVDPMTLSLIHACTLRAAIQEANALPGHDTINFDIPTTDPGYNGQWWTIRLLLDLPSLTDPAGVTINALTQPEAAPDPDRGSGVIPGVMDAGNQGQPLTFEEPEIAIDGDTSNAFTMQSSNNTVRGMSIYDTGKGGPDDIGGNFPGYAVRSSTGVDNMADFMFLGVLPDGSDPALDPLAPAVGERNRGFGAQVAAGSELTVNWSLVGHNGFTGIVGEANTSVLFAEQNEVFDNGWATVSQDGIDVNGINSIVRYNLTYDNTNLTMLPRGDGGNGIELGSKSFTGVDNNLIEYNSAFDNLSAGVSIRKGPSGNFILKNEIFRNEVGIAVDTEDGRITHRNELSQNSIYENFGLGIDLQDLLLDGQPWMGHATLPRGTGINPDGVTPNDHCDLDTGSNDLQNYPELSTATTFGTGTDISGMLDSEANTTFTIEFFSTPIDDMFGVGDREGRFFIGSIQVTTGPDCIATFNAHFNSGVPEDQVITATATKNPPGTEPWSTSEFSAPITVNQVDLSAKVTGGGFYDHPSTGFPATTSTDGTANFGFNAMYRKKKTSDGTPIPEGKTNFVFREADIHFLSIEYAPASLIVTGGPEEPQNARWRGLGWLNQQTLFGFEVNLTDRGEPGALDSFRIHIWREADGNAFTEDDLGIRYENGSDATEEQIEGGNLQIHIKANALEFSGTGEYSATIDGLRELQRQMLEDAAQAALQQAIALWREAGVDEESLRAVAGVTVVVADLADATLGLAVPSTGTIVIDSDAAGSGWFVDSTLNDNAEFHSTGGDLLFAVPNGPAFEKIDLLTVVAHELGHLLGFGHSHEPSAMAENLLTGVRLLPELAHHEEHGGALASTSISNSGGQLIAATAASDRETVPSWLAFAGSLEEQTTRSHPLRSDLFAANQREESGAGWPYPLERPRSDVSTRVSQGLPPAVSKLATRSDAVDWLLSQDDEERELPDPTLFDVLYLEAVDQILEQDLAAS